MGYVSPQGTVSKHIGSKMTLRATPLANHQFTHWMIDGQRNDVQNPAITITGEVYAQAYFAINRYTINATDMTGGGTFDAFSNITLTARNKGVNYLYEGVYEGNTRLTTSYTYSFEATGNRNITARYKNLRYDINIYRNTHTDKSYFVVSVFPVVKLYTDMLIEYRIDGTWNQQNISLNRDERFTKVNIGNHRVDGRDVIVRYASTYGMSHRFYYNNEFVKTSN